MISRKCGYQHQPSEAVCLRYVRYPHLSALFSPFAKSAQDAMMREVVRYSKSHAPSEWTPLRGALAFVLLCVCVAIPLSFGKYAWRSAQVSLVTTAAAKGDLARVRTLITADARLTDAPGYLQRTPLYWAAVAGRTDIAQLLLTKKAKLDSKDQHGWTPLHAAAFYNRLSMVEFLFAHQADLAVKDREGRTSLHAAAAGGSIDVISYLRTKGLQVNDKDNTGWTPLHVAASVRQTDTVSYLLENGANVNARANNGATPLRIANEHKRSDELIDVLVQHGAEE